MATGKNHATIIIDAKVQLQDLSKQIKEMQNALGKVKVDSADYRGLQKSLNQIQKTYKEVETRANQAFSSQAELTSYEKKIEKLRGLMTDFGNEFRNIGAGSFTEDIFPKGFLKRVEDAKKNVNKLAYDIDELGRKNFASSVAGKNNLFAVLNDNGVRATATYDEMERTIRQTIRTASQNADRYRVKVEQTDAAIKQLTDDVKMLNNEKSKREASTNTLGAEINQREDSLNAFQQDEAKRYADEQVRINQLFATRLETLNKINSTLRAKTSERSTLMPSVFTNGGDFKDATNKENLATLLSEQVTAAGIQGITKDDILAMSRDKVQQLIKDIKVALNNEMVNLEDKNEREHSTAAVLAQDELKEIEALKKQLLEEKKELDKIISEIKIKERELKNKNKVRTSQEVSRQDAENKKSQAQRAQQELADARDEAEKKTSQDSLQGQYQDAKREMQGLTDATKGYVNAARDAGKAGNNTGAALGQMSAQVRAASAELDRLKAAQAKLSNLNTAIARWFGFREVLNLTKQTVRNMINDIRDLDEVITEISIVTNFSQEDLWKQMPSYSAMAKEYGTSIKGVYKISQLYYQQG